MLTFWRGQREGQFRTRKGSNRAKWTHWHHLETAEGQVRIWKESEQAICTHELDTAKGWINRDMEESDRARPTHELDTTEGETSQDMDRKGPSDANSLAGDGRRDESGYGRKVTEWCALTLWRRQREQQVRIRKESDQARHTHFLETADGQVRMRKESDQAMCTYVLDTIVGGTVRTRTKADERGTHDLETTERRTSWDMKRKR